MADTSLNEDRLGILIWQTSNIWQSKLRKILKEYNLSLNEYLIIETIYKLMKKMEIISQITISKNSSLDVSVISTSISLLEQKKLIFRKYIDNRSKNIILTEQARKLISSLVNIITNEEKIFFNNLRNETFNFTNSLKLLLGKKIRIKVQKS